MRVLIVDNTIDLDSWGSKELARFATVFPGATFYVRRAPHDDLPKNADGFDRVIVSGSKTSAMDDAPWIEKLLDFIRRTIDQRKPYLGVCYGHQMLVRSMGGKQSVRLAQEPEFGWAKIEIIEDSPLTKGVARVFHSFAAHFDEVGSLPNGFRKLARSQACDVQAVELEGLPVYGVQFHPERTAEDAKKTLATRKKLGIPKRLLHPNESEKLYQPELGETLFRNFFQL